ncbi:11874_t:CDS:2, partial [Gigaspora margarita]
MSYVDNGQTFEIKQAHFTINNKLFKIQYRKVNQEKIDDLHLAVLKSLDKGKISCEAYRLLVHINQDLLREGAISSTCQRLNKQMQNLVRLSLTNIKETSVASELTKDQSHITDPNIVNNVVEYTGKVYKKRTFNSNNTTIKLRISEDGKNVGQK